MTRDGSDTSGLEEKKDLYQVVLDQQSPLVGHPLEGAKKTRHVWVFHRGAQAVCAVRCGRRGYATSRYRRLCLICHR